MVRFVLAKLTKDEKTYIYVIFCSQFSLKFNVGHQKFQNSRIRLSESFILVNGARENTYDV